MNRVSSVLQKWYSQYKRDLPWRNTQDAYIIWLSEIILQQTRVEQGLPYFNRFLDKYPTVSHFAKAKEDEILKLWQGLGYYSRARNMHFTAKVVHNDFAGRFPEEMVKLKKLKGVGDYTAAAIASFAYNRPHAVVDGNVYRFLARYFGIKTPIDSTKGKQQFLALADGLLDKKNPANHNQAIMEFGARQCKPANPLCDTCPFNRDCVAFTKNKVQLLPVKSKKQKIKTRHFNYLVVKWRNKMYLHKRIEKDIWKNLYEFPLIETAVKTAPAVLMQSPEWNTFFGKTKLKVAAVSNEYKHQLSHQTIYAVFYSITLNEKPNAFLKKHFIEIAAVDFDKYGVPRLVERFMENF